MSNVVKFRAAHYYYTFKDPITLTERVAERTVTYGQNLETDPAPEEGADENTVYDVPQEEIDRLARSGVLMTAREAKQHAASLEESIGQEENPLQGINPDESGPGVHPGVVPVGDDGSVELPAIDELADWQVENWVRTAQPTPDEILAEIRKLPPEKQGDVAQKFLNAENVITGGEPRDELVLGVTALLGDSSARASGPEETGEGEAAGGTPDGGGESGPEPTDAAETLAAEHGVDLSVVPGTGSEGRVTKADVEKYLSENES